MATVCLQINDFFFSFALGQAAGAGGGAGFGFGAGLGTPLVSVTERKPGDEIPEAESSGIDEIDAMIREAEMKQSIIEQELLDLAWGDDD